MIERWRRWAKGLKRESLSLYLAMRDPRTPWYAKVAAACVVAYALSPTDLIPDPIPVLGYLDDLVLVPWHPAGVADDPARCSGRGPLAGQGCGLDFRAADTGRTRIRTGGEAVIRCQMSDVGGQMTDLLVLTSDL